MNEWFHAFAIDPVAKGRPRFSRFRVYTPAETVRFERAIAVMGMANKPPKPLDGPLKVVLEFYLKRPKSVKRPLPCVKPDVDNFVKAIIDALNGIIWEDDGQICDLVALKRYASDPKILLRVTKLLPGDLS